MALALAASLVLPRVASAEIVASLRQPPTAQARDGRPQQPAPSPGFVAWEWWNDADVKHQLGLTEDKVKRIDDIYRQRTERLKPIADRLDKEQELLERMTVERVADEGTYAMQVVLVESLHSQLHESRLEMLYHIYKELSPEQYQKLQEIGKRRADEMAARGRSFGPPPGPTSGR